MQTRPRLEILELKDTFKLSTLPIFNTLKSLFKHSLTTLILQKMDLSQVSDIIFTLPNIIELNLDHSIISIKSCIILPKLLKLSLQNVTGSMKLQRLAIESLNLRDSSIIKTNQLILIKGIKELDIIGCDIDYLDRGLINIFNGIEKLKLGLTLNISNEFFILNRFESLKELEIIKCQSLSIFSINNNLQSLSLESCRNITKNTILNLINTNSKLKSLNLTGIESINEEILTELRKLINLEELNLSKCNFSNGSLIGLIEKLMKLKINNINDQLIKVKKIVKK
jgi:hypothetical protein